MKKHLDGTISITSKGVGYFTPEDGLDGTGVGGTTSSATNFGRKSKRNKKDDIEIQPEHVGGAYNEDTVRIELAGKNRWGRTQGKVLQVLKRAKNHFVGTTEPSGQRLVVVPDDKRFYGVIEIEHSMQCEAGYKVAVHILEWKTGPKNPLGPLGKIEKVIGKKGDNSAEMESIVIEKGFYTDFPAEVEHEALEVKRRSHDKDVLAKEYAKRRDFRNVLTFTIDPFDAKDFDDAISIKEIGSGRFEIGVHIADVSHYVVEGSALDREAVKRACSVYLVDRTIPMLPEILSNDLCSLNPHEDKMAFSAVFEMDEEANIYSRWFGKTVINSDHRFTYETAQESIKANEEESGAGKARAGQTPQEQQKPYTKELQLLNKIAKKLAHARFKAGSIDFEKDEVKFELDKNGKPLRVYRKVRFDAHKMVEDFMLLANREVAYYIFEQNKKRNLKQGNFIYRIHDTPDPEKIIDLSIFIKALGYELESHDGKVTNREIRALLDKVTGTTHEELIKTATIRSMAKAIYSTQNIGHFGLAFQYYTHFTSPIRRYPDLLVHRVLLEYLEGRPFAQNDFIKYEKLAEKSTEREIEAAEAERSSIKYKQVEYMQDKLGKTFEGTITGVTEWGVYIEEKETKCEGMMKVRDMNDDYYVLDEKNYCLVGEKTKKIIRLSDKIHFQVVGADLERKVLDYKIV